MPTRVALANIPALTFYQDSMTLSQRTKPIPQLVCIGKACDLYMPEVVRCENVGGHGGDVDWKCEADLPKSLRFGKVEVSCEGWSGRGDPYVLKGSCGLEYRLIQVPKILRDDPYPRVPSLLKSLDFGSTIFIVVWMAILVFIVYGFVNSCLRGNSNSGRRPQAPPHHPGGSGWFPGGYHDEDTNIPPPPYSKTSPAASWNSGWRPGFWTGAALGGLGAALFNNRGQAPQMVPRPASYDWEYNRLFSQRSSEDRGEGPSNLGAVRRSTGLGGSNIR